jgi:hypothetical protein
MAESEFTVVVTVQTKKKMSLKEMDKVAKWLKKGLTIDEATYEKFPVDHTLFDFPKVTFVDRISQM